MRLPKQVSQIVHLTDKFNDDEPYPVGVAVDECRVYARDTASGFEFGLGPDPSLVQSHDVGHELPDTMCVVILYRVLIDYNLEFPVQNLWYPSFFICAKTNSSSSSERRIYQQSATFVFTSVALSKSMAIGT